MATFLERLAFLQKVPILMKATADDETPCPGYVFQEIGKICHDSLGYGQCLLEYLLERLQADSCHVKLKVLKIFVHLCGHGSKHFLTELRRNSTFIQQASVYSGPPDPIHGTALYQKVRNTAQEVARLLFTDAVSIKSSIAPHTTAPLTMGMGSAGFHRSGLQGFGYSPGKPGTAGSDSLLDKIQKAAEVVASTVLPPAEQQGICLHDNHYRAVLAPSAPIEVAVPACAYNLPVSRSKAANQRCPGQVAGGWEEIATNSRTSMCSTRSQSGASRESSGDVSERTEALPLGDCGQETSLINKVTEGSRVFLSKDESQHFLKECFILNCEVVVELLSNKLQEPSYTVRMRALCAVACLMTSDLLSLEQIFGATQCRLYQLSAGPPGLMANKATKILRQFDALMGGSLHATSQHVVNSSHPLHTSQCESSSAGVLPSDQPSSPLDPEQAWRCFTEEDHRDENLEGWEGNDVPTIPAADVHPSSGSPVGDIIPEPQSGPTNQSGLSLFRGMELVTKGRVAEADQMDGILDANQTVEDPEGQVDSLVTCVKLGEDSASGFSPVTAGQAQLVSAFTFINF
uniref:ENTH domain containing 2 n=2 Tax=Iconisemion striatum TaxID=60296 RepID=A0A1A7XBG4_9TELE